MGNKQGQPKNDKKTLKQEKGVAARPSHSADVQSGQGKATAVDEAAREEDADSEKLSEEEELDEDVKKISFSAELGGGRGWPPDSTVVRYHDATGLVIAGTESGALYAYGDGFQYMQPGIQSVDITHIISLNDDRILVGFADNSLAVLMLPSLNLSQKLASTWLNAACGDITTIHVDHVHSRPYAYVGTSGGYVRVLQVLPDFREVEYCITCADTGVTGDMAVSDLEICPKDERHLLIAYDSNDEKSGAVVIYDMVKHKTFRIYKTVGITTAAFNHTGEALFAGTRAGEVLSLGIEKAHCTAVWSSRSELLNEDDYGDIPVIRRMQWMHPQSPTEEGCLFVLLGSIGLNTDNFKSVIVALLPSPHGAMRTIFSVPPLANGIEVVGFRIVSTIEKQKSGLEAPVPGILLLGQSDGELRDYKRDLLVMRCPASPIVEWELEIGMLPDPRVAVEVLPGKTSVTCMVGCMAGSGLASTCMSLEGDAESSEPPALSAVAGAASALEGADDNGEDDEEGDQIAPLTTKRVSSNAIRRVSMRDFYNDISLSQINFDALAERASTWEMVLANGERDEVELMDVLFAGHDDGSVIVWGVSSPQHRSGDDAIGSCWVPLTALRCASFEVTNISHTNNQTGENWLVVGDDRGTVVVWTCNAKAQGGMEEKYRCTLHDAVTASCIDNTGMALFVGTQSGTVHSVADWNGGSMLQVEGFANTPAQGAVRYIFMAPFWRDTDYQIGVYVIFSSGHVVVIHAYNREVMAYSECFFDDDELGDYEEAQTQQVVFGCVINAKYERVCSTPDKPANSHTPIEAAQSTDSLGTVSSTGGGTAAATSGKGGPSNFMKKFKRGSSDTISLPYSIPPPPEAPRYVLLVQGHYLRRCELVKFARVYHTVSSQPEPLGCFSRPIAAAPIVCANVVSYIEDAARFWTQPIPSITCVDDTADVYVVSTRSGLAMSRFDALPQVIAEPYDITCATVLPNGNTFLCSGGNIIFCSCPSSTEFQQTATAPSRATTMFSPPDPSLRLAAPEVESATKAKQKRRGSFLSSGPADLDKLFLKTYEQRQKDELFRVTASKRSSQSSSEDHKISRENVAVASSSASNTKATLDQTRLNFEERGERLSKLNQKMEDFGLQAKEYKANSAAHREKMRKKAQKWGVF